MPADETLSETIKLSLQYSKEASERVRKIVVLLLVASIVTFIAWWNHYQHSWTTLRLTTAQNGLQYLCDEARKTGDKWAADACPETYTRDMRLSPRQIERAQEFLEDWRFTRKQLERHVQDLQDQYVSGVLKIDVPFFGMTSDVNDLGILAGIALVSLFLFTIWREEQNVTQLFALARTQGQLPSVLRLFAMTQVFTIPPWHKQPGARRITGLIYSMPVMVYFLVTAYDVSQTIGKPKYYREPLDWITLVVEVAAFLAIGAMRFILMHITRRLDAQWQTAMTEANTPPPPGGPGGTSPAPMKAVTSAGKG